MSKCETIIKFYCMGMSIKKIIKQLMVPKSTVYDAVARYRELGNTKDCPRSGCPCSGHMQNNFTVMLERVTRNPKQSMRKMAQQMNIDPKSMRVIVKTDLKLFPFKLKCQQLTALQKKKRADRA